MSFTPWLSNNRGLSSQPASRRKTPAARRTVGFRLECLEDRVVLSTLTVLNHLDQGTGSLRAEIATAHSGDTIVFAPSLDGQTITLTSGELLIKKNLTIAGPGAGELTVSGNNASRVFEVAQKENVILSGLTISTGEAQSGDGGGIANHGTLTVSNSILSNNTTLGPGFEGGAVYNDGTLTVSKSALSNNTSYYGGAIENDGTLTVSAGTLSANSSQQAGGGIYNRGTLTVSGSTLSGNTANIDGGGIWNNGSATVSGSTLSGNAAQKLDVSLGGGIYNIGTLAVSGSTLSANSADAGGGGIYTDGTLTVSGSTLSANVSHNDGGGIDNYRTLTVSADTLSANVATYRGGGIANYGTLTVDNSSTITGNTAPVGFGADIYNPGVVYLDGSSTIGILDGNATLRI